jgi:hypothetical protein
VCLFTEYKSHRDEFPNAEERVKFLKSLVHDKMVKPTELKLVEEPDFWKQHVNALV